MSVTDPFDTVKDALLAHSGKWRGGKPHESPALSALISIEEERTALIRAVELWEKREQKQHERVAELEAALREAAGFNDEVLREWRMEGDTKMCAEHVRRVLRAALATSEQATEEGTA